jgi:Putative Flp pilus-assembly TadE/G-like
MSCRFPPPRKSAPDQGSASLWLLGFVMVFWVSAIAGVGVGQAMIARHRVAAAADLGVLAGAQVIADAAVAVEGMKPGTTDSGDTSWINGAAGEVSAATKAAACAQAGRVVAANGGELRSCDVAQAVVQVVVGISLRGLGALMNPGATTYATARAGWS